MVRAALLALLLSVGPIGACAGKIDHEDGGDGGEAATAKAPPKPSPVTACGTYGSTWCVKAFGCYVQVGRLDEASEQSNIDQCTQLIIDKLPCSAATGVGDSYDTCLTQIKGMACSKWDVPQLNFATVVPPSTCDDALSFE